MGMRTLPLRTSHWEVSGSRFLVHKFLLGIPLWCKMTPKCLVDVVHWMVHYWVYHIFLLLTQRKSGPKVMWIERVPSWKRKQSPLKKTGLHSTWHGWQRSTLWPPSFFTSPRQTTKQTAKESQIEYPPVHWHGYGNPRLFPVREWSTFTCIFICVRFLSTISSFESSYPKIMLVVHVCVW